MQRIGQRGAGRIEYRGVKQAGRARRRRMAAFAFPGVQPDVVVIAAGRNERRAGAQSLHDLEAEHAAIKSQRAIEIGHLEMNMPDAGSRDDRRWGFGHMMFLFSVGGPAGKSHASSETSPSGRSNSKVFSVIETMV